MSLPDFINAGFELAGGVMVLDHCRQLVRHREVKGVSIAAFVVFFAWGLWNLFYYPHLGQWASFAGGIIIVCGNFIWLALAISYRSERQ